jgi:hypothetical protein
MLLFIIQHRTADSSRVLNITQYLYILSTATVSPIVSRRPPTRSCAGLTIRGCGVLFPALGRAGDGARQCRPQRTVRPLKQDKHCCSLRGKPVQPPQRQRWPETVVDRVVATNQKCGISLSGSAVWQGTCGHSLILNSAVGPTNTRSTVPIALLDSRDSVGSIEALSWKSGDRLGLHTQWSSALSCYPRYPGWRTLPAPCSDD